RGATWRSACAVPSCGCWRANCTFVCPPKWARTASAPCPTTTVSVSGESASDIRMTRFSMEPPGTRWSTFGWLDFIRVPWPAARITTWMGVGLIEASERTQELNPDASCTSYATPKIFGVFDGSVKDSDRQGERLRGLAHRLAPGPAAIGQ